MFFRLLDDKQHEPWEQGTREERRRCRSRRKLTKTRCCSSSTSLQQRVESLQRHVYILQSARKDALLSAKELQTVNEKMSAQLSSLTEKLSGSKQVIQVNWLRSITKVLILSLSFFVIFAVFCLEGSCIFILFLTMLNICG